MAKIHEIGKGAIGEVSNEQADVVTQAIAAHNEDRLTCYDHDGLCCPCGGLHDSTRQAWERHRSRAVLRAALEVSR